MPLVTVYSDEVRLDQATRYEGLIQEVAQAAVKRETLWVDSVTSPADQKTQVESLGNGGVQEMQANRERNRTAQLGSREKHGLRRLLGPEPAVSGSDTPGLDRRNPAQSREFLGL